MSEATTRSADKVDAGGQQSDAATEANKSDDARAKDAPEAGNILGGVQSE